MSSGPDAGYLDSFDAVQLDFRRQLLDLLIGIDALHRKQGPLRAAQVAGNLSEASQVRKCSRYDDVYITRWTPVFHAFGDHLHVGEAKFGHCLAQEGALLMIAFNQQDT